jgi:Zn-dependent protease with chaperone function
MQPAVFFDGHSSRRRAVSLAFTDRVEIADAESAGSLLAAWPYDSIRRADGPEEALRLASTAAPPLARLELRDPMARAEILSRCPALDGPGSAASISIGRIVLASLAAAAAIVAMVWFGMPFLANRLTALTPYAWEKPLGDAVDPKVRLMFGAVCTKPDGVAALNKLVGRLQTAANLPNPPEPAVLRASVPNAFALSGGRVYLLSGLLTKTESPDELAGVLAHEFGHVARRDGLRRLIREGGTSFLVGLMFGDVSGSGVVLMAGRMVLNAAHGREAETAADAFAATVMHRLGRPVAPMAGLLERVAGHDHDAGPSLLRDHPLTADRKAMLEQGDPPPSGPALLDPAEWQSLKRICG